MPTRVAPLILAAALASLAGASCTTSSKAPRTTVSKAAAPGDSLADLPLKVVATSADSPPRLAIMLTGDGGWAEIDRAIADSLVRHSIEVVALDSRAYLARKRSPEESSRDLARIMTHYMTALRTNRVVLIGYSRGADILPFIATRLPAELLSKVSLIALLGPTPNANFQFHLIDLVSNHHRRDDLPTIPEIAKLHGHEIVCFYGAEEKETACRSVASSTAISYEMPGGHHFDERYGEIADRILAELATPGG